MDHRIFTQEENTLNEEFEFELTAPEPSAMEEPRQEDQSLHAEQSESPKPNRQQSFYKEARDILVIVCLFMVVYVLFFRAVVVVGNSMYDTLVSGDRLLVLNNLVYQNPKQGDIIVASKDSFRDGECIIKRVIATEGQIVDIDFKTGTVYVDGQVLDETYIFSPTTRPEGMKFPLTVDAGCIFVMGDNRRDSMDSRDPAIGLIDRREVVGKAIFLLWPGNVFDGDVIPRDFGRIGVVG